MELLCGGVLSNLALLTPQWKQNMWLLVKHPKRLYGLENSLSILEVVPNVDEPMTLYCDNSGAVANSKEHRSQQRSKHIERKYHLIREIAQCGDV